MTRHQMFFFVDFVDSKLLPTWVNGFIYLVTFSYLDRVMCSKADFDSEVSGWVEIKRAVPG